MKILITGASGYLGSSLANRLAGTDHRVFLLLRPGSKTDRLDDSGAFEQMRCSTDAEIDACIRDVRPDIVLHTACSYGRNGETPLQISDANLRFGLVILQALQGLERPSTVINTGTVLEPDVSLYALTKDSFARAGRYLVRNGGGGLRFVNVLLQQMYGPGDDPTKFAAHVLDACYRNVPSLNLTLGEQKRDMIYIDDVVDAFVVLAERCDTLDPFAEVEVGSGDARTIRDFVEKMHRMAHSTTELCFGALPYRPNEPMLCEADLTVMNKLGWHPAHDLETGIRKYLEWNARTAARDSVTP